MTGYTVHTGASKKFVSGWDRVFGTGTSQEKSGAKASKKSAGKSSSKKKGKK